MDPPGAATAAHLRLLRPPLAAVEQAMAAETEAASGPDAAETAPRNQPVPQPERRGLESRPDGGADQPEEDRRARPTLAFG